MDVGEARPLARHPTAASDTQWAPDGRSIYFLAEDANTEEQKERDKLRDDVYAFDENFRRRHTPILFTDDEECRRLPIRGVPEW